MSLLVMLLKRYCSSCYLVKGCCHVFRFLSTFLAILLAAAAYFRLLPLNVDARCSRLLFVTATSCVARTAICCYPCWPPPVIYNIQYNIQFPPVKCISATNSMKARKY